MCWFHVDVAGLRHVPTNTMQFLTYVEISSIRCGVFAQMFVSLLSPHYNLVIKTSCFM